VRPSPRRISVAGAIPGEHDLELAADVFLPEGGGAPLAVFFCFPGGGLHKGYFDLAAKGRSFARAFTARGFAVVTIDSLGWGESGRPRDGFALVPEAIAAANAVAVEALAGELDARWPGLPRIGVGHSLGALLAIVQQAEHESFDALVLLGASMRGLRVVLSDEELAYADRPEAARAELVRLARKRSGGEAWFELPTAARAGAIFNGNADRAALAAMRKVGCEVVSVPALFSMIPGCSAPWAARVRVPVFLGIGERDITGPPHELPASFPASPDVTLLVLPATGHSHFAFSTCPQLFARVAAWVHERGPSDRPLPTAPQPGVDQ
jgi:alpha-beta hydrolase superfamily lysophospholipase